MAVPTERDDDDASDSVKASLEEAIRRSSLGQLNPGEVPRAASILKAIGGVRGLVESILPALGFLVVYTLTQEVVSSVLAPVAVALIFVVIRLGSRSSPTLAFSGLIGVGISAALALMTGRAEDNFLPGLLINVASVLVLLISLALRWPLIGIVVGFLANEGSAWRSNRAKRKILTLATWLWVGLFSLRLIVQAPLYFASQTELLAGTKLVMGVPLYAGLVWVTWLLVRTVYPRAEAGQQQDTST